MQLETRSIRTELKSDEGKTLRGHAAVWDSPTEIYDRNKGRFTEVIRRGAFRHSLERFPDVRALWNHNEDVGILGRTQSNTLKLWEDERGLAFALTLPDSPLGHNVKEAVRRGDVDACSFGFNVLNPSEDERWSEADGKPLCELLNVRLGEISMVVWPAYPTTSVSLRSIPKITKGTNTDLLRLRLELKKRS